MSKLRICLVASEIAPFAKTGGLADVVAGLAHFLDQDGHDVRLFMPLYRGVRAAAPGLLPLKMAQNIEVKSPSGAVQRFSAHTVKLKDSKADVVFIDCPSLYDRDGIYRSDGDDHVRFGLLSRATLETCQRLQWAPDVIHCNDWHTALIPLYLRTLYAKQPVGRFVFESMINTFSESPTNDCKVVDCTASLSPNLT